MKTNQTNKNFLTYEKMPDMAIRKKRYLVYLTNFLILIILFIFLYHISSIKWYGALIGQFILVCLAVIPFAYITKNIDKIRQKYLKNYKEFAYQKFYYNHIFLAQSPTFISNFFPILLKTDYFLPKIIDLPTHSFTTTLLPIYIAMPIGIFLVIFGSLLANPLGSFNFDSGSYVYFIYPEKSKMVDDGIYRYIRHPKYLSRLIFPLGLAILANNVLAICVAIMHFLPYLILIPIEDKELSRRLGKNYMKYRDHVPALIPHFKDLKKFFKILFRY